MSEIINRMVSRFLGWKLPANFNPDAGISFTPEFNKEYMATLGKPPMRHEPLGTNLFDADQAKLMIEYIAGDEFKDLQQKLLASQASEARLRGALEVCKWDCNTGEVIGIAKEALSTPPNTAELEAHVESEVEKRLGEPVAYMLIEEGFPIFYKNKSPEATFSDKFWEMYRTEIKPLYAKKDK